MSSYLLAEDGDVLNSEAGERLTWDAPGNSAAVTCLAGVGATARRLGVGQAAIAGGGAAAASGHRIAVGGAAIAGLGAAAAAAVLIARGAAAITANGMVSGLGRLCWDPVPPSEKVWTEQSPGASPWLDG